MKVSDRTMWKFSVSRGLPAGWELWYLGIASSSRPSEQFGSTKARALTRAFVRLPGRPSPEAAFKSENPVEAFTLRRGFARSRRRPRERQTYPAAGEGFGPCLLPPAAVLCLNASGRGLSKSWLTERRVWASTTQRPSLLYALTIALFESPHIN